MTVDRITTAAARDESRTELFLDGLLTGMIGALAVAVWFLVLDFAERRPFYTPALLGTVLLHGSSVAANGPVIAPLEVAAYTAVHFLAFVVVGIAFAWLMAMFERFPIVFFVLLVLFLSLQVGVVAMNAMLGTQLVGLLPAWEVAVANLLAAGGMVYYQWRQHPNVVKGVERLWEHDAD